MNRLNFYSESIVDDTKELDFLYNSLSKFEMKYNPAYYRVTSSDFMRPKIISYKVYGTTEFWWIIMSVNGINNPLVDLTPGTILQIPSQLDIYDFQKQYRLRRNR